MIRITIDYLDIAEKTTFEGSCCEVVDYLIKTALSLEVGYCVANALRSVGE